MTEDVGVIDSFKPLYKHDVYPPPEIEKELEKEKNKSAEEVEDEESDNEDNDETKDNDYEMVDAKNNDTNGEKTEEESEGTDQNWKW